MDLSEESPLLAALRRGGIHFGVRGTDRESVLEDLVGRMGLPPELDRALVLRVLLEREALRTTGLGHGVAIPHCHLGSSDMPVHLALGLLESRAERATVDGKPVRCVFCTVTASDDPEEYTSVLRELVRLTRDPYALRLLAGSRDARGALECVCEALDRDIPATPGDFSPTLPAIQARIAMRPESRFHTETITRLTESVRPFDADARFRLLGQNLHADDQEIFVESPAITTARASDPLELLHVLLVTGAVLELTVDGPDAEPACAAITAVLAEHASSITRSDPDRTVPEPPAEQELVRELTITNTHGFHLRPAAKFATVANRFESRIRVSVNDGEQGDGKSILDMSARPSAEGGILRICVCGPDGQEALAALVELVSSGFELDVWS